jgi:hypothetical protein
MGETRRKFDQDFQEGDFAKRRGHSYATILIDKASSAPFRVAGARPAHWSVNQE